MSDPEPKDNWPSMMAQFPDEFKRNEEIAAAGTMENVLSGYIQRGKDLQDFKASLPRAPKSKEEYEFGDVPDGLERNEEIEGSFKDFAFKNGLSKKQATAYVEWYNNTLVGMQTGAMTKLQAGKKEGEKKLREEWGDAYDKNFELGHRAATNIFGKEFIEAFSTSPLGNDIALVKGMFKIGEMVGDGVFVEGGEGLPPEKVPGEFTKAELDKMYPTMKDFPERRDG